MLARLGNTWSAQSWPAEGLSLHHFTGNVPEFDLIVVDDNLTTIPIQVKSSRSDNWPTKADKWINIEIDEKLKKQVDHGDAKIHNPHLIYVCVALATVDSGERDRFFVLQKRDLQKICAGNYRNWMDGLNWKRPKNHKSLDNRYYIRNLEPYENNWSLILKQLRRRGTA